VAKKSMIKNPGKENFFLNGRKIVLGWPTRNTSNWCSATGSEIMKKQISSNLMLSNSTKGDRPSTHRRKLMAEIYLAIPVVYRDLPLLLYYLSHFTISQLLNFISE
jgi:hypothetical protein